MCALYQPVYDDDCLQGAETPARDVQLQKKMTAPKAFPRVAMDLATTVERIQQVGVPLHIVCTRLSPLPPLLLKPF